MQNLIVNVKKEHPEAVIPEYATEGSAGLDLVAVTATSPRVEACGPYTEFDTGLVFEIPKGYVGLFFPRSSIVPKTSYILANGVGVIDSDYRGTIKARYRDLNNFAGRATYKPGDKIGQLVILPYPMVQLNVVNEVEETERGEGGFGSTDQV